MSITCLMQDADEKIAELMEEFFDIDAFEVECDEDQKMIAYTYKILIPSLDIYMREGAMMLYYEDEQDWYADFSLTLIYNNKDERLYWEQDGIEVSLYNFLNITNNAKSMAEIGNLECIIEIDGTED